MTTFPQRPVNTGHRPEVQTSSHGRHSSSHSFAEPTSAQSIPQELQELRSLAELTKARVNNLEALLEPPALTQVTETKRIMRDAHRNLERLRIRVAGSESAVLIGEATVEAWQVYQRLVRFEEKLRKATTEAADVQVLRSASLTPHAPTALRHTRHHSRHSSGRVSFGLRSGLTIEKEATKDEQKQAPRWPLDVQTWSEPEEWEDEWKQLRLSAEQLPPAPASVFPATMVNEPQVAEFYEPLHGKKAARHFRNAAGSRQSSSEGLDALLAAILEERYGRREAGGDDKREAKDITMPGKNTVTVEPSHTADGLHALNLEYGVEALPTKLAPTRKEVQKTCSEEETCTTIALCDPERKREGSMPGLSVTYAILAGIDDPMHCLPRLRFIKIHEVKRLKEWLTEELHLGRSGEISRVEKMLHLIFILQEGWRMETIAVLFSRTPLEVYSSCHDVFNRLLEMHSETALEWHQPTCYHLWKIAPKFLDKSSTNRWERYYHWKKPDVFSVLVTLNMYIGRYRQQGKVALDGPYQHWWRHFAPPEPTN